MANSRSGDPTQEILRRQDLVEETMAALPALEAVAKDPAGMEGVTSVITRRFELFPQPMRTEEQWMAWWPDYFAVLEDVPMVALERAMVEVLKIHTWSKLPLPAAILDAVKSTESPEILAAGRARRVAMALETMRGHEANALKPKTPEQIAAVKEMMASFSAQHATERSRREAAKPAPPEPYKPPLTGGLSAAMRRAEGLPETLDDDDAARWDETRETD